MDDYLKLLIGNTNGLVTASAFVLLYVLVKFAINKLSADFSRFERVLQAYESKIFDHMSETRRSFNIHSDNIEKLSKELSNDLLRVKVDVLDLKQELMDKIEELKDSTHHLEQEVRIISASARDNLNG